MIDLKTFAAPTSSPTSCLALAGASIGNRQIDTDYLRAANIYAQLSGDDLQILITGDCECGGPAKWNYLAAGFSDKNALRYAASKTRHMHKLIEESINGDRKVISWPHIYSQSEFLAQRQTLEHLLNTSSEFYHDAAYDSQKALQRLLQPKQTMSQQMLETAMNYLIDELALLLAAGKIFSAEKVTYYYYREWPIYQKLISGHYDKIVRKGLKMVILNRDWDFNI